MRGDVVFVDAVGGCTVLGGKLMGLGGVTLEQILMQLKIRIRPRASSSVRGSTSLQSRQGGRYTKTNRGVGGLAAKMMKGSSFTSTRTMRNGFEGRVMTRAVFASSLRDEFKLEREKLVEEKGGQAAELVETEWREAADKRKAKRALGLTNHR